MSKELSIKEGSALDKLRNAYPQHAEDSYVKTILPQITFKAKAVLDDAGEKVVIKAGTFMLKVRSEEQKDGKYEYTETALGDKVKLNVLFERYRLSFYDSSNEAYVSSPIFDSKDEIVKLFSNGKQIASGTVAELQALPEYTVEEDGKKKCKLQLQKVLYVFHDGQVKEMAMSLGNGYVWRKFKQENVAVAIHIEISSEKTENGGNKYNQMVFKNAGWLSEEEAERNLALVEDIKKGIESEKAYYGQAQAPADSVTLIPTALPSGDDF
jgi:hypothetical protein